MHHRELARHADRGQNHDNYFAASRKFAGGPLTRIGRGASAALYKKISREHGMPAVHICYPVNACMMIHSAGPSCNAALFLLHIFPSTCVYTGVFPCGYALVWPDSGAWTPGNCGGHHLNSKVQKTLMATLSSTMP